MQKRDFDANEFELSVADGLSYQYTGDIITLPTDKVTFKEKDDVLSGADLSAAVKKALEFIREHYEAPISLQDAADAAEVNPAYLSYLFKQEMKIGFSNYVQELRIDYAKKLLSETNCKVKDVALRSGFGDYHYFSKIFKKITGLSPAEYRKESGLS